MKKLRSLLVAVLTLTGVTAALAQPANDPFAAPVILSGTSTSIGGTTVLATKEVGEPNHGGNTGGHSVWYEWTAPFSAPVTMTVVGNGYRALLGAYIGSAVNALGTVAGASAGSIGGTASFTFNATASTIYKIATDGRGGLSGTFTLSINQAINPVITLTAPIAGQIFTNPASITLSANATPVVGTVTNVSFYYGGSTLIGSDTNSPYSIVWSNMTDGGYTITARATDTAGLTGISAGRNITIRPVGYFSSQLVGSNSVSGSNSWWKYLDNGSDQGTAWQGTGFDDSTWLAGPAEIGYGEVAARMATTNLSFGPDPNNKYITTYFRHSFTANNVSIITNLLARYERDDGVILYLNGVEVVRDNMPGGAVDYLTLASANAGDDGAQIFTANINPALLVNGVNVLAAEIHQDALNSSDITWYLELTASGANGNPAPSVAITSPVNGANITTGSNITINATASDSNGTVTNVAFYANATNFLGNDTVAPYSVTWNSVPQGDYTLTAVATDNEGASTVSVGVNIGVSTYTISSVTLIASNSVWKYLDDGTDQGTGWSAPAFNDAAWASGPAELGYGDLPEGRPEATVLCCSNAVTKFITYYFRRTFNVANAAAVSNLTLNLMRDDGAVVYVNGVEVRRDNLPAGTITAATLAPTAVGTVDEYTFFPSTFGPTNLVTGANTLAVEIHQNATTSSDISFDLELIAQTLNAIAPSNTAAPFVASQNPIAGATVGTLTSIQVTFSEPVTNVNAADLLINNVAATGLSGGPTTYTFTFPQPPLGPVNINWAVDHGITDRDPAPLPFDEGASSWSYNLADVVAPTIIAKNPAAGSSITNLTSINVTFSEPVAGVNAGDLLVNGTPASGLVANSAADYTFTFGQPAIGTVAINWISGHGIVDTSPSANAFNTNSAGANWSYTLTVPSSVVIASNTPWKYFKGFTDASSPVQAWRQIGFDDSSWSLGATPFNYSTPYTDTYTNLSTGPGTYLADMQNNYQSVYLRHEFVLTSASSVSNFIYRHQSDDGFVAWINGVEVLRYNMAASGTDPANLPTGVGNANEPNNTGAGYLTVTNTAALGALVTGTNILAVQACNASLGASSDFGFNLEFSATIVELNPSNLPPRLFARAPAAGDVTSLTSIQVTFSEPVSGVEETDLLINGAANSSYSVQSPSNYTFTFPQPAYGPVAITWAVGHNIFDFDAPPKPFDATAGGATWSYNLINPNAPVIASQFPQSGATLSTLTSVNVTFSKNVSGVNATDLLISGAPATGLTGSGSNYTFTFAQPAYGNVGLSWAASHGIFATGSPADTFDATRPGNTWSYTLIDLTPPTLAAKNPPAGANVTNLTSLSVTFSENVIGVNASDLLINNVAATQVAGSGANYTFTFPQPNTSIINVTWAASHGISDTALNPFDATAAGASWQYFTPDTVPPAVTATDPWPDTAVRDLTSIQVTFNEPVTGVNASDLTINTLPASSVAGSGAGPYTFHFTQPATGHVDVIWAAGHGITDLAVPPNNFAGGEWTYELNPNAIFAGRVVVNEIMFQPPSLNTNDEWFELKNLDAAPMHLNGWRITKGVDYQFPNVTIPPGGYLVVAANTNNFHGKYPAVANYVGPWTGTLANHDGNIQLETADGELVNTVHYASEGEWALRTRGPVTSGHRGWVWRSAAAEGTGPSLELVNSAMPNAYGNNWRSSTATNGTPGAANATARTNIAPLVLDMAHFPTVPRSTDSVVVTAKVLDERTNGLGVTLYYRNSTVAGNSNAAFTAVAMFDDGAHNDGVVNDQVWAATIPAQTNNAVIEFYVQAVDLDAQTNSSPALALDENGVAGHYANALYQVDDTVYAFPQPLYKLVMTEWERREREVIASNDAGSNAQMNGTLITVDGTGTEIRYNIGIRERGAGSRGRTPPNHRVNVPTDRRWKGQREFNLNSQYTHAQYAGYLLSRKAGLDTEYARIVRLTINNTNNANSGSPQFGCYIHVESPNSDMAAAHWPLDDGGNMYRVAAGNHAANLAYLGTSGATYASAGYAKVSNTSEDDWNDLVHLTDVLNNTPDSNYVAAVRSVANVEQWMLYFAMNTLLVNMETSLGSGYGDDYGLYSAPREGRFYLMAHDWDTILGEGDTAGSTTISLFRTNGPPAAPTLGRLLGNPEFVSIYYATLRRLCQTTFSPAEVARTLDEGLTPFAGTANIQSMKQFASNRVAYVLSQLPSTNTVAPSSIGGTLATNTVFAVAGSPYTITSSLTVPAGVTLIIQPGVTVQVAAGATITVSGSGVLLAKGTPANHIRFTKSGASNWGSLDFINAPNESRLEYVDFDSCAGTTIGGHASEIHVNGGSRVFFNYLNFANFPAQEYISFDGSSFIVQNSTFPTYPWATSAPEMLHGVNGINAGGYGIFRSNYFGHTFGFNDTIDFTGGQRPGPILQVIGNVFDGAGDDNLDLDSTDAWIEGNIFMHVHRDPNRTDQADDTGSAISGGVDVDGQFSEWTVINNLFYDVDHVFLNKGGVGTGAGRVIFVNNTVAHVNQESGAGPSTNIAAFIFSDDQVAYPNPSYGAGAYIAGNIIWDYPKLVDNYNTNNHTIIFENNLLAGPWGGLGSNNVVADPLLNLQLITTVTNATAAQVRAAFTPKTNSPALGTGFGGFDKGGLNPKGLLFISGPTGNTNSSSATLRLFPGGVFHWGTVAPNYDWGYTKYKWRLDDGPWSAELAISNAPAINLAGLPNGRHTVYVSGRNDAGYFQDDAFVYPTDGVVPAHVTASHSWTINSPGSGVRLNEVLASNQAAVNHEGTHPDLIELQNGTGAAVDVGGLRLTDDASNPDKFIFDPGTVIPAGGYLVVYANNEDGTSGIHLGFSLNKDGQGLYLYESVDRGGLLVDSVVFGLQVADFSIGRVVSGLAPEGAWQLCVPTAGGANVAAATGPVSGLVINEILAAELSAFPDDFVELYNPAGQPVALGGLYFTDNPANWPGRSVVPALTFIGAGAYIAFHADGKTDKGADHLDFSLEAERGLVALLNTDYSVIDCVIYGPQSTDVSQGRVVGNIYDDNFFITPTPGAPNGGLVGTNSGVVLNEVLAANSSIAELDGSHPDWIELYNLAVTNVDLGDWSLTDSAVLPRQYVFAPGTIIAGNGYLRLRCDGGIPAGPTNTGFNLKAEGGSVYVFDKLANGGGLLNAVTYGLQAVDFSISRVPNGSGNWALTVPTPGGASILASAASAAAVKVNEWMPRPSSGEDWFELWNPNNQPVAIGGFYTTDDLNNRTKSPIPALSYLGASTNGYQRFWADSSPANGANHTSFGLNNTTESIGFANPSGTLIDSITYNAPASGVSEGRFPDGTANIVRFPGTESPGEANYLLITNVVINEALTHTDPPLEDAIELRNLSGVAVNIGNWWLSDAKGSPRKYRITNGLTIPANGFVVFYETQFNNTASAGAFSLSSAKGDQVYLSTGDTNGNLTGFRTSVDFGAAQNGWSFGRYVTSDGREEFVTMSGRSFGQDDPGSLAVFRTGSGLANPYPKVGPVVIAQVMYHPPDIGTNDDTLSEFIELRNITGSAQPLYDPLASTNTWRLRDGVDFDFPMGVSMPAGTRLLVVSFDPGSNPGQVATFRARYGVDGTIPIYGPYTGKLANSDDKVELYRPDNPDAGFVPYVLVDRVHYFDAAPWPTAADGAGAGLSRVSLTGFGNDATNWVAVVPNFGGGADTDGDGMPDAWETLYGLDPNNANDAGLDADGDGLTNLQEYIAGTNPRQAASGLRFFGAGALGGGNLRMYFNAVSNRSYSILYKNGLVDPAWTKLFDVTAAGTNRTLMIDTVVGTNRFFWLRTPQAP